MSDDREFLTYDQAVAMLPEGDEIHTFAQSTANVLIGADWPRERVLKYFKTYEALLELSGSGATKMKHGIAVLTDGKRMFFATK